MTTKAAIKRRLGALEQRRLRQSGSHLKMPNFGISLQYDDGTDEALIEPMPAKFKVMTVEETIAMGIPTFHTLIP